MKTIRLSPFVNSLDIKKIEKDTLYYVPARIIPALVGFLGITVYTRLLNPNEYGLYILVMSTVSMVYAFGFNWIGYVVWRYFEKYKNGNNLFEFLSSVFTVVGVVFSAIALLWYTMTILLNGYTESHFAYLLRIGIVVLGVQIGLSLILEVLRISRQSKRYSLYSSIAASGTLLLAIGFLYILEYGAEGILLAIILISGGISLFEIRRIYKQWKIKFFYISPTILKKILTFGIPQIGIAGGATLLSIADRYLIGVFIGSKAIGIYGVGYTIADLAIQLPLGILTMAAIPVVVGTFENKSKTETSTLLKKLLCVYFIVLTPIAFGIAALSKDIINIVAGEAFRQTAIILPWVVAGVFFFGLSQIVNIPFQLKEKPYLLVYLIFSSAILNIVLNLFMIPRFGILGAAYATLIAYFIYCIVSYRLVTRIFTLSLPWVVIGKSFLASIGMFLTLYFVTSVLTPSTGSTIFKIGVGACSYFLILMLLNAFGSKTVLSGLKYVNDYLKR